MADKTTFAGVAAVLLIILLVVRELAAASESDTWRRFARYLSVGVLPLLLVFFVNVGMKLYELVAQGQ